MAIKVQTFDPPIGTSGISTSVEEYRPYTEFRTGITMPVCTKTESFPEDVVNQPKHYVFSGVEVIEALEAWNLDFRLANVVKYVARAGRKDPEKKREDLEKALWYLKRYIEKL